MDGSTLKFSSVAAVELSPISDIKEQDKRGQEKKQSSSLRGIIPICFILAFFGLLHFRHGPYNVPIVAKISQVYVALIMVLNISVLIGDIICVGISESTEYVHEISYIVLSILSCLNAGFLIYLSSSQKRLSRVYKALETADTVLMYRKDLSCIHCKIFMMIFLLLIHLCLIVSFMVIMEDDKTRHLEMHVIFLCPMDGTVKLIYFFCKKLFWVTTIVLPCCLYIYILYHGIACMGAARKAVKRAVEKRTTWEELSSSIETAFDVVDAMNMTFCYYLFIWLVNMAFLAFLSFTHEGELIWMIALVFIGVLGILATAIMNRQVCILYVIVYKTVNTG